MEPVTVKNLQMGAALVILSLVPLAAEAHGFGFRHGGGASVMLVLIAVVAVVALVAHSERRGGI
jgi:hypothetical protein